MGWMRLGSEKGREEKINEVKRRGKNRREVKRGEQEGREETKR